MPGKKHNQTCSFIDKEKCCKKNKNLHFEFHDPWFNTVNAVEELRKILKNKKLLLLGDSLMVEFFLWTRRITRSKDKDEFLQKTEMFNPSWKKCHYHFHKGLQDFTCRPAETIA